MRRHLLLVGPVLLAATTSLAQPASSAAPPSAAAPASATGQAAPAPSTPDAAAPAASTTTAKRPVEVSEDVFERGVRAVERGDHRVAAEELWHYLKGSEPTADHYEWAELYLARAFLGLGLNNAGVEYLYNVARERKRPELLPEALSLLERIRETQPFDEELIDLDLLAGTDFGALPPSAKSFVEYQQGRIDVVDGHAAWAERHFQRLQRSGDDDARVQRYALRARVAQALSELRETHVKDTRGKRDRRDAATKALEDVVAGPGDDDVKNEARRVLAELYFEEKRFDDALKTYDAIKVAFLSEEEADLFLEKAWARFYKGDARGALGILLTLDAPAYRKYFSPERFVLKALAYKSLCHYASAKAAAREFLRRYGPSLAEVRRSRDPLTDPALRAAAVQRKKPRRLFSYLASLQKERDQVERFSDEFGLAQHLGRLYDLKIAATNRDLQRVVQDEATDVAAELLDYEEQARLVDYEVSLEVFRRLKEGKGKKVVDIEADIPLGSREVYYRFDGEYWNDELHDYRFRIDDRCFAEELFQP
jgi:tetratricopeptide (TPR) repeat protein